MLRCGRPTQKREILGMDFGEAVAIDRIAYTPRGDGNDVTPGDVYEVLYWDCGVGCKKCLDF